MSTGYNDDDVQGDFEREGYRPDAGEEDEATARAMERTNLPGIFLIVVSILNILGGGYMAVNGIFAMTVGKEHVKQQLDWQMRGQPDQKKEIEKLGWSMEGMIKGIGGGYIAVGIIGFLAAIITLIAGVKMRSLSSYGLCVFGSILACIPCLSVSACCGLGEGIGIWALVVLLSQDVKSCFR